MDNFRSGYRIRILSSVDIPKNYADNLDKLKISLERTDNIYGALKDIYKNKEDEWGDICSAIMASKEAKKSDVSQWIRFYYKRGVLPPEIYLLGGEEMPKYKDYVKTFKDFPEFFGYLEKISTVDVSKIKAKKVLIVDDNTLFLADAMEHLAKEGYEVETQLTGEGAVERINKGRYSVAVIDKNLPGKRGTDIIKEIKDQYVGKLLASVDVNPEDIEYIHAGADNIIPKGNPAMLVSGVKEAAAKRRRIISYRQRDEKVLLVDDKDYVCETAKYCLGKMGFKESHIFRAKQIGKPDEGEAYKIFKGEIPDLVITDFRQDGISTLLEEVKKYEKSVILMSNYSRYKPTPRQFLLFDVYLEKPVYGPKLARAIEEVFEEGSWIIRPKVRPLNPGEIGKRRLVAGPPTAGKNYVCELCTYLMPSVGMAIRDTTRPKRLGEKSGEGFNFLSDDEFLEKHGGNPLNYYISDGYYYSTFIEDPVGKDILIPTSSVDGLKVMAERYPDSKKIFLGIGQHAMIERMHERPDAERKKRMEKLEERIFGYRDYFPKGNGPFKFDLILMNEGPPLEGSPASLNYTERKFRETRRSAFDIANHIIFSRDPF